MISDEKLIRVLQQGPERGVALARRFGLTRAAVSKRIRSLRAQGIEIVNDPVCGYRIDPALRLLDVAAIHSALPAEHAELPIELFWSIDSTQAELLRRSPAPAGCVLVAESQRAGRGRRGRAWCSPLAAHLYLSLAWSLPLPLSRLGGLPLVLGAALVDALRDFGYPEVGLKWPNDLFARGRKLGGILLDVRGEAAGPVHLVLGVGINVRMPTAVGDRIDQPWIDLASLGSEMVDRNRLAAVVIARLVSALQHFDAPVFDALRARWADYDVLSGQPLWIDDGRSRWCARALGIATDGGLCVEDANGRRTLHAGDVSLRTGDS